MSATDNVNAYKIEGHRHSAEVEQELGGGFRLAFVAHLVPVDQGILASCYATVDAELSNDEVQELYRLAYMQAKACVAPPWHLQNLLSAVN